MDYKVDEYGRIVVNADALFGLIVSEQDFGNFVFECDAALERYNEVCRRMGKDDYIIESQVTPAESLEKRAKRWLIPDYYLAIDVEQYCLERCSSQEERDRVLMEMVMFKERNLIKLLQSLIYCVDQFRKNKVLWGVGRGSSVASFVLYLIGVHRINSMEFGLDIREFLR